MSLLIRCSCFAIGITLAGCSQAEDSPLVSVQGQVLFNGQPISKGSISFVPEDLANSFSGNVLNGQYTLGNRESGKGALPGKYRVAIMAWETSPTTTNQSSMSQQKEAIPRKFFDATTSGLEAIIPLTGGEFNLN